MRSLVLAALLLGGCDLLGLGGDGGSGGAVDMAGSPSVDLAAAPDLTVAKDKLEINWFLYTAQLQGGSNNGFPLTCTEGGVTALTFTVTNAGGTGVNTVLPCSGAVANGSGFVKMPDLTGGPFTISAVADGKPKSASEKIRNVMVTGPTVTVRIYADGCDSVACK